FLAATTYGDSAAAEAAVARVRRVHEQVRGIDPVTGLAYSADDADLLAWIHAVEVDSFLCAYRAYAGSVSDADADRYVGDMAYVAERLGLPAEQVPRTLPTLRAYLDSVRGLQITPAARDGFRVVLFPPMNLQYRPLWAIPTIAAVALLPRPVRRMYGI